MSLDQPDCRVNPGALLAELLSSGYRESAVKGRHILALATLPRQHADPFDRLLIAQAPTEGMVLITADRALEAYGGPVRKV